MTGWLDLGGANKLFGRFWAPRIMASKNGEPVPAPGASLMCYAIYAYHRAWCFSEDGSDACVPSTGIRRLDVKKNMKKGTVQMKAKVQGTETIGADGHTERKVSLLFGSNPLVDACPGAAALACTVEPGKLLPSRSRPHA